MSWNPITTTDVTDELSPQELAAFNTLQNQSTTQNNILQRVVNEVRGSIRAGGNQMDAEGLIPDQLRNDVIDICLWRFIKKFPALKALASDARKDAYTAAKQKLTDMSKKDSAYRIELPNSATAEGNPSPINASVQISGHRRQLDRHQTKGL